MIFFSQEQKFLVIFLKFRKKSYFTKLCMTMILLVIYVFYGAIYLTRDALSAKVNESLNNNCFFE